ncbi:MAG: ribosome maturation factor RimM [Gaiellales bacterium]
MTVPRSEPDPPVAVGRVGKPHGLDGAFVVELPSDDPGRYRVGARLVVDGEDAEIVVSRRVGRGRFAIRLDRPVTRGTELFVRRSALPAPEPDTWYAFELQGLAVRTDEGDELGEVVAVYPGVANDNLELSDGRLIPLIDDAVLEVDVNGRRIVVRAAFLG